VFSSFSPFFGKNAKTGSFSVFWKKPRKTEKNTKKHAGFRLGFFAKKPRFFAVFWKKREIRENRLLFRQVYFDLAGGATSKNGLFFGFYRRNLSIFVICTEMPCFSRKGPAFFSLVHVFGGRKKVNQPLIRDPGF